MSASKYNCMDSGGSEAAAADTLTADASAIPSPECRQETSFVLPQSHCLNMEILLHPSKNDQDLGDSPHVTCGLGFDGVSINCGQCSEDGGGCTGVVNAQQVLFCDAGLPNSDGNPKGATEWDMLSQANGTPAEIFCDEEEDRRRYLIDPVLQIARNKAPLIVVLAGALLILISMFLPGTASSHGALKYGAVMIRYQPYLVLCSLTALVAMIRFSFTGSKVSASLLVLDGLIFMAWTIHNVNKAAGPAHWAAGAGCLIVFIGGLLLRFQKVHRASGPRGSP